MPHNGFDPVFAGAQIVSALQGIITRNKRPIDAAVISVTQFHAGDATNIVPDQAWIGGTVRTFTVPVLDLIERRMEEVSRAVASAFDCTIEFNSAATIRRRSIAPPRLGVRGGRGQRGGGRGPTWTATSSRPWAPRTSRLCSGKAGLLPVHRQWRRPHREAGTAWRPCMLHNLSHDFNDELLPVGSTFFVKTRGEMARRRLSTGSALESAHLERPATTHTLLDDNTAEGFARVALDNIVRRYPYKLDHLMTRARRPRGAGGHASGLLRQLRLAFGSPSCTALLVRLLGDAPGPADCPARSGRRSTRSCGPRRWRRSWLTSSAPASRTFERPYGWAWCCAAPVGTDACWALADPRRRDGLRPARRWPITSRCV